MPKAFLEHNGDSGILHVCTHFNTYHEIPVIKESHQNWRLGGTAVDALDVYPCEIARILDDCNAEIFIPPLNLTTIAVLGPIKQGSQCYCIEYYDLEMEGKVPGWLVTIDPPVYAKQIFINLDILNEVGDLVRRYRVSTFTGQCRVM